MVILGYIGLLENQIETTIVTIWDLGGIILGLYKHNGIYNGK